MTGNIATQLLTADLISIVLTATNDLGKRIGINESFTGDGINTVAGRPNLSLAASASSTPAPTLDTVGLEKALRENRYDDAADISREYQEAFREYSESVGGSTPQERINSAVFQYLKANHNVSESDHAGLVLTQAEVMVKAPMRAGPDIPAVWLVQLAPKWG